MNTGYLLSAASLSVLLVMTAAPASAADGKLSGAAPDVARAIFEKLGIKEVVASISEYGAMIPGLQAGRHDAITAGLFMKPERCAAVAYSEPVLCDAEAM